MHKTFFILFALFGLADLVAEAHAQADYKIVTGPERGTYILQIGQDLSKIVAELIGMDLDVPASKGSAENVQRMRYEPGVKFALVQSDVYQAYLNVAKAGNVEAGKIIQPLRPICIIKKFTSLSDRIRRLTTSTRSRTRTSASG